MIRLRIQLVRAIVYKEPPEHKQVRSRVARVIVPIYQPAGDLSFSAQLVLCTVGLGVCVEGSCSVAVSARFLPPNHL